jgi:hypothetical protein
MYLFTRSTRLGTGNLREQMAWSQSMTEKVNQISELEFTLWTTVFSPAVGTLVWTTRVEDLASLEATQDKLMVDDGYHALVEAGSKFSSGEALNDELLQLVHADPDAANAARQYVSVVRAVLAPGRSARGIELGVEIAQRAKKITGRPTSFGVGATGIYGGVEWISLYESVEQVQKAQEAIAADTSFAQLIDKEASQAYLHGVATQTVYRKII